MLDNKLIENLFESKKQKLIKEIRANSSGVVQITFAGEVAVSSVMNLQQYITKTYPDYQVVISPKNDLCICAADYRMDFGDLGTSVRSAKDLISYLKRIPRPDPLIVKLLRRAVPKMMAFDVLGVQPMKEPAGMVFAIKSKYTNKDGEENGSN